MLCTSCIRIHLLSLAALAVPLSAHAGHAHTFASSFLLSIGFPVGQAMAFPINSQTGSRLPRCAINALPMRCTVTPPLTRLNDALPHDARRRVHVMW